MYLTITAMHFIIMLSRAMSSAVLVMISDEEISDSFAEE